MSGVHLVVGITSLALGVTVSARGLVDLLRRTPSGSFWPLLRAFQAAVVAQFALGLILIIPGAQPPNGVHTLFGFLSVVVLGIGETGRERAAQRVIDALPPDQRPSSQPGPVAPVLLAPEVARRVQLREIAATTASALGALALATGAAAGGLS